MSTDYFDSTNGIELRAVVAATDIAPDSSEILREAVKAIGADTDGVIEMDDVRTINRYIRDTHLEV
ncbi:MAG: hypothetical protein ABW168_24680 [Sedimenticola sp.]